MARRLALVIDGLAFTSVLLRFLGIERLPTFARTGQVRVVDRRAAPKRKLDAAPGRRPAEQVRAVVAHQFDDELGLTERQIRAAGGDVEEALIRRACDTPYHVVGLRCGVVVLVHDVTLRTYHAGHGNGGIGLGIEGSFPTLARQREPKHTPIEMVAETARVALRDAARLIAAPGKRLELQAHRQWSGMRVRDPGEELWRTLRPVADELGMVVDPELRYSPEKGLPIPREWDEQARYDLNGRSIRG